MHAEQIKQSSTYLPPCCIQVHPEEDVIFFGTYLLEQNRSRTGSLDVYNGALDLIQSEKTDSSMLDLKISPQDHGMLVSAMSTGSLILWRWRAGRLKKEEEFQLFDQDVLVLSVVFSAEDPSLLSVTLTNGQVSVLKFAENRLEVVQKYESHDLECWISAFVPGMGMLLSGGDDQTLAGHDIRTEMKVWQTKRIHEAGVTSILPRQDVVKLWTGGYDDMLKECDMRMISMMQPRSTREMNLGGGVWRLIPRSSSGANYNGTDTRILACCMYGGARILEPDDNGEEPAKVSETITENHNSMVYGGDWGKDYVVTCSFYDKIVQEWKIR